MRYLAQGFEPLSQISKNLKLSMVNKTTEIIRSQRRSVMKRLLLAVITVFSVIVLSASAIAAGFWKVNISSPANTTSKTFNVQYQTMSVDQSDDFLVELFQNGAFIGSQSTTTPGGDSGVFQVTVSATGTYSYFIKATNSNDETPRNTSPVSVTVSDPPAGTVTTVVVDDNGPNTGTTGAGGAGGGTVAQGGGAGGGATDSAGGQTGQVGDQPATTQTPNDGDVLGSETKPDGDKDPSDDKDSRSTNPLWYVLGLAALSAIGYWAYTMRVRGSKE